MEIQINDEYRFTSDSNNIIIQKHRFVKPKEEGKEGAFKWIDIGYYGTLEGACIGLLKFVSKQNEATSIKELKDMFVGLKSEILVAIKK